MKLLVSFLFLLCLPIIIFGSCPSESIEFQNFCYFFISNATQFPDAELICNEMNGNLASIHDAFTNAILTSESTKFFHDSTTADFWIGLNYLMTPGNWSWTDNSSYDFKEWCSSEPQNFSMSSCAAVTIKNGCWASSNCFNTKPYVCKIAAPITTTTPSYPVYMNCSRGWIYFEPTHSCYGQDVYGNYITTWKEAEKHCLSLNAHLVSLHNYDELKFVSSLISQASLSSWTGLYSNDDEKTWHWTDGSPVDYLPWGSGYPNRNDTSCAVVMAEAIYDYDCSLQRLTLCKKPA